MDIAGVFWGDGEKLDLLQMSVRALSMFFIALVLIRLGGMRIFGKRSAFDTIIIIMLGAILARGVIGASPFWSTVAASATMVLVNRLVAWLCAANDTVNDVIKGKHLLLCENGQIHWDNMKVASLSKSDLMESLRLETKQDSLEKIEKAYMETNGRISFLLKKTI
ncbi:DUF421 domain-containing protein [Chitinophaga oryzae]|uniref:DUF421 domain-containing protein n=1 Tax=Chitinophaga oryzae TaxID=2725414 RepID=A0AAE6ZDS2_9BACT|nr:YetF domain-containing protein [Chitinophaga oryzae]QJB30380.1 DUF421 domain-containing protein [Chitinophaga oryzae]QJB36889.1 DUF421 domain-containing protein [Chitinophaga oryzae]